MFYMLMFADACALLVSHLAQASSVSLPLAVGQTLAELAVASCSPQRQLSHLPKYVWAEALSHSTR